MSLLQSFNSIYGEFVTFIGPSKAFRDIVSSDISHECYYKL